MRSPRRSADEQYNLVMECRSSGLSDQQWCLQHDINPGTFYNWVKRLRAKKHYDIPAATRQAGLTAAVKQDVVKVEILQDHSGQVHEISEPSHVEDTECILPQPETAPIEIHLNKRSILIKQFCASPMISIQGSCHRYSEASEGAYARRHFCGDGALCSLRLHRLSEKYRYSRRTAPEYDKHGHFCESSKIKVYTISL